MALWWSDTQVAIYQILQEKGFNQAGVQAAQAAGYGRTLAYRVLKAVRHGDMPGVTLGNPPESTPPDPPDEKEKANPPGTFKHANQAILGVSFMSRAEALNPEIILVFDAAREQLQYDGDLPAFIYDCVDLVRRYFQLTPPGWALVERQKFPMPKEWESISDRLIAEVFGGRNGEREPAKSVDGEGRGNEQKS